MKLRIAVSEISPENSFKEAERAACGERPLEATAAMSVANGEEAVRGLRSSV